MNPAISEYQDVTYSSALKNKGDWLYKNVLQICLKPLCVGFLGEYSHTFMFVEKNSQFWWKLV